MSTHLATSDYELIKALHTIVNLQAEATAAALDELREAVAAQDEQIAELRERLTRHQDRALLADVRETPYFDRELRAWVPMCPHGDRCSGCDVDGWCAHVSRVSTS